MKAAGVALACVVIGGGMAVGYVAADRELLAPGDLLGFFGHATPAASAAYPYPNRDNKLDRMVRLRTDRADIDPETNTLKRGDSLRQSYAAVDPAAAPAAQPLAESAPMPKARPKIQLLRRLQASYTLLSDLQIDAIRTRLKLNAEQERNWPAVEGALRGLATRLHDMKRSGEAPSDLSPDTPELVRLKTAATPFFAQLSAEQKRELKMLAHLIGLGRVVAQL